MTDKVRYDLYRGRKDRLRLATLAGAKLPAHLNPKIGRLCAWKTPQSTPTPLGTLPPRDTAFFKLSSEIKRATGVYFLSTDTNPVAAGLARDVRPVSR